MEHLKLLRDLQLKQFKPFYFLCGEEPYFADVITDYMEEHILEEDEQAFGMHILYGRDTTIDQIVATAKSYPMGGGRQLVILKESQDLKEWKKTENLKALEVYLANPTPSTILVFTFKGKALDKRLKITKLIEKAGVFFVGNEVKEYQMPSHVASIAAERGLKLDPNSTQLLVEYLGTNLGKVVNAIQKLRVILPEGSKVTTAHIEEYIGISKDYNNWELQKALGNKEVLKANKIIDYFRSNPKQHPIQGVLPFLYSYFSRLAAYQSLTDKSNAARLLETFPAAIAELKLIEKNFTPQKLERIISNLRDADRKSKGVGNDFVEDEDLMKELVFKILH